MTRPCFGWCCRGRSGRAGWFWGVGVSSGCGGWAWVRESVVSVLQCWQTRCLRSSVGFRPRAHPASSATIEVTCHICQMHLTLPYLTLRM
ncbi:hypothetical protein BDZ91DRAFT_738652 [Kalaharituber pfeilii]|nr:hypothetical protein BDZ91DRAFT_738652 [Kalaharituber pfeilii]